MQSRAAMLPAEQEKEKKEEVHIPTREKAEVNREHFEQLNEEISYLSGEAGPTADQQFEDPIYFLLAGQFGRDEEISPFFDSKQYKIRIDLSELGEDRDLFEEELKKAPDSYLEVRYLNKDVVEITNPYYLPSELRKNKGSLAKKIRGFLEKIRDSGSPSAIMAAHACMIELRDYFSTGDLNKLQQSSSPNWLKEHFSALSKEYSELGYGMVDRIEYISNYATGKNRLKPVSIPEGFEKSKKRTLKEIAALEKDLLDGSLAKTAIKRIEWGIKRKCYSVVEVAFYENVRKELEGLLMEFRGKDYIEKGFSAMGRNNSEKVELALRYVGVLETIAWKADLEAVRLKLNAAKRPGKPGELMESLSLRSWIFGARSSILWGARSMAASLFHKRPPKKMRVSSRSDMLGGLSVYEEMCLVLSSKRDLAEIGRRASAYSRLLSSWVDETLPGARIGSEERRKRFSSVRGDISRLSAEAGKLQGIVLPPPEDEYWEKTEEISITFHNSEKRKKILENFGKIGNEEKRERERKKLSWQHQAEVLLEVADAFEMDVSREQKAIGEDVLRSVEMARNQDIFLDENASWDEKVAAYNRQFVMQNAVPILAASTAIGGVLGFAAGGVGAKPGAILGWGTGSLIVAAAGTFNTGEALADYLAATTEAEEENALSDLRGSAFYMGFGIGGGPLKFFSGTAAKAVSGTSFFGLGAANSVLLYHDIKRASEGDSAAYWEIPADVAFIAIGSVGFMKTFSGAWKTVSLPRYVSKELKGKSLIGGSFALTERQIGTRLPKILSRSLKWGYAPKGVIFNSVFSLPATLPDIQEAAKNGDYQKAFSSFSPAFTKLSRAMVTFEFALAGLGAGRIAIARKFPLKTAARVRFLQSLGLHRRISKLAAEGGIKLNKPKMQERLVEIAFASRGKFRPEQIQRMLGLEGSSGKKVAERIAEEVSKDWELAVEAFPAKGLAKTKKLRSVWKKAEQKLLREGTVRAKVLRSGMRIAKRGAAYSMPVLIGSVMYFEYKDARMRKLDKKMAEYLAPAEADFRDFLAVKDPNMKPLKEAFGIPDLSHSEMLRAFKKIDSVEYSPHRKRNRAEKSLRIACAWALMMREKTASLKNIEELAKTTKSALIDSDIVFDETTFVDSLAQAAYVISKKGRKYFVESYETNADQIYEIGWFGGRQELFMHNTAGIYSAVALGKRREWAAAVTSEFLHEVSKLDQKEKFALRGGQLLSAINDLSYGTSAKDSVRLAVISERLPVYIMFAEDMKKLQE